MGETPIHIAIRNKNIDMLKVFEKYKNDCLLIKDVRGENPLFYAGRSSSSLIYNWFYSGSNQTEFFKARGEQNYKG